MARPMPPAAPVTTATFPSRRPGRVENARSAPFAGRASVAARRAVLMSAFIVSIRDLIQNNPLHKCKRCNVVTRRTSLQSAPRERRRHSACL